MKNISIYKYIASSKPFDAYALISKTGGYKKPEDVDELEAQMKHWVRQNGSQGLMQLAKIHPDRELIVDMFKETDSRLRNDLISPTYNNMSGNNLVATEPSTTTTITKQENETISLSKMMIWGSVVLISVAIIM